MNFEQLSDICSRKKLIASASGLIITLSGCSYSNPVETSNVINITKGCEAIGLDGQPIKTDMYPTGKAIIEYNIAHQNLDPGGPESETGIVQKQKSDYLLKVINMVEPDVMAPVAEFGNKQAAVSLTLNNNERLYLTVGCLKYTDTPTTAPTLHAKLPTQS